MFCVDLLGCDYWMYTASRLITAQSVIVKSKTLCE